NHQVSSYNIITCASFGSGVVTDYFCEYYSIKNLGDYEFWFLQDYDGVSTLEDALVHSWRDLTKANISVRKYFDPAKSV
ncbi:MAG: hypothetical protein K2O54_06115, partial [Prevotella sp.]|nr:hypothetical protein [Prevotella sp.]